MDSSRWKKSPWPRWARGEGPPRDEPQVVALQLDELEDVDVEALYHDDRDDAEEDQGDGIDSEGTPEQALEGDTARAGTLHRLHTSRDARPRPMP